MQYEEHPIGFPQWEPSNPSGSFQKFADYMHDQAKNYLLDDGYHAEMLFFMPLDGKGTLVLPKGDDRDEMAQWVRDYIAKHYIFGLVHVCESWVKFNSSPNDHTVKQIVAGEIKVSELKPEHRTEALSVSAQSRDGFSLNWIDEMVRHKKKGSLKLGKCHQFSDFEGRFGKLFG
jgi:hypothetical protein